MIYISNDKSILEESTTLTLKTAGFISKDDTHVKGLITSDEGREIYEVSLRHGKILDEIDLLYESPGTLEGMPGHPCIYFKKMENISSDTIIKIRREVWNIGRAPILWIITPTQVHIYDAFARPEDDENEYSHILDILKITAKGLEGINRYKRELFDTNKFWESEKGRKIDPRSKVDNSLLDDLWETERILTKEVEERLSVEVSHAFLGRSIFMAYLWDRRIITSEFLKGKFGYYNIKELFNNRNQFYKFFHWLRNTFNGNLFPITEKEEREVKDIHLNILKKFFEGTDMATMTINDNSKIYCQKRLWPYNFEIIPVELISSIYEMFAHSKDPITARAKSIHYTKVQLVELILSLAMKNLSDDANIFDPTCGSGVFLADAFRRLIWKRRMRLGRELRHEEICEILLNQIYGMDVEKGAIEVAAFSLYLTLLEFDEYTLINKDIRLPNLVYNSKWDKDYTPVLYVQDICNTEHEFNKIEPFSNRKFDLIVGNLPWTELNSKTAPRDPDNPTTGRQWTLEYIIKHKIPSRNPDQAIMHRIRDFTHFNANIAVIVCSRIFYQLGLDKEPFWINSFQKDNNIYMVINFTDLVQEKILFGGKAQKGGTASPKLPGSVFFYTPHTSYEKSTVLYICPKWYPSIKSRGEIIIYPPDVQTISLSLLKDYPDLWKIALRGSQSDFELIRKLSKEPFLSLKEVLHEIGIDDKKRMCRGYEKGKMDKPSTQYIGWLHLEAKDRKNGKSYSYKYILSNPDDLPTFEYKKLEAPRKETFFKGPLLLFRRSLIDYQTSVFFTSKDIIYCPSYIGISFEGVNERYAHRMNAIFNSNFALYLAFMMGREFAWLKRLVEDRDWKRMPLPRSILDLNDQRWNEIEEIEKELREKWNENTKTSRVIKEFEDLLLQKIYEVYGLTENERIVVSDTLNYTIELYLKRQAKKQVRKEAIKEVTGGPNLKQIYKYAEKLSRELNNILDFEGKKLEYQLYDIETRSPLTVIELKQVSKIDRQTKKETVKVEGIEDILIRISDNLRNEISDRLFTQGHLRIYEKDRLYIIKPAEKRFWTESAALNDVSNIIEDHMGLNQNEKPELIRSLG